MVDIGPNLLQAIQAICLSAGIGFILYFFYVVSKMTVKENVEYKIDQTHFIDEKCNDLKNQIADLKWNNERIVRECLAIVNNIKHDPLTQNNYGGKRRWMEATCEDIETAIKNRFGVV
jgi:hypothetical protein